MTSALLLLQSTGLPVGQIALDVGYESASRFAIRFRERFGCAPSAIRARTTAPPRARRTPAIDVT
jgi:AraC-like DNA-binding protein